MARVPIEAVPGAVWDVGPRQFVLLEEHGPVVEWSGRASDPSTLAYYALGVGIRIARSPRESFTHMRTI